jgi:tryptophan synthase alpha chain
MSRIRERFEMLRDKGEGALVVFLSAGDPDMETSDALILAMAESGADVIEIGVPFSDPTADGPTIQRSSERGLASGASLQRILYHVGRLRDRIEQPIVLMGYANPFFAMGSERFASTAAEVGVDGVIVPDLPPEEGEAFFAQLQAHGIDNILLAAPTTTPERMKMLAEKTRGFLYYVSLTGVTSARSGLPEGLREGVAAAQALAEVPVCVGFGISRPEHAREVGGYADGVVVGSAIVDRIEAAASRDAAVDAVAKYVAEMKAALRPEGQPGEARS